jgi:HEAT repeat protein
LRSFLLLFALAFLGVASLGILPIGGRGSHTPEVRAAAEAPVAAAEPAELARPEPAPLAPDLAAERVAPSEPAPPDLRELVERLPWRPLSMPDWRAAARAVARGLDDAALASLTVSLGDPELSEPDFLASTEVLREAQSLRGARFPALPEVALERLGQRLDRAEDDPELALLAATSLAALGGPVASRTLLDLALAQAPDARALAARGALADSTEGFVAEALATRGADEDLALLERLAPSSRWAFDGMTRFVVADRATSVGLDAARPISERRRALLVVNAWDERAAMELSLEILADPSQPAELVDAAAGSLVRSAAGDLSPVETMLLETDDLERATTLAAALAANARQANGWSRSVASRALCRAAESAESAHARRSALLALGSMADSDALVSIARVLRSEDDATVRGACIVALSKWPANEAVARLIEEAALNDPSPSVRALAENARLVERDAASARE